MSACVRDIGANDALFRAGQFNVSLGNDRARRIGHRSAQCRRSYGQLRQPNGTAEQWGGK